MATAATDPLTPQQFTSTRFTCACGWAVYLRPGESIEIRMIGSECAGHYVRPEAVGLEDS